MVLVFPFLILQQRNEFDGLGDYSPQQRMSRQYLASSRPDGFDGFHARSVNFQSNRAAKQRHRHNNAMSPFETNEDSFQAMQDVLLDSDFLANLEIRPRLGAKPRGYDCLDGCHLAVIYRHGNSALTDNRDNTGCNQYG